MKSQLNHSLLLMLFMSFFCVHSDIKHYVAKYFVLSWLFFCCCLTEILSNSLMITVLHAFGWRTQFSFFFSHWFRKCMSLAKKKSFIFWGWNFHITISIFRIYQAWIKCILSIYKIENLQKHSNPSQKPILNLFNVFHSFCFCFAYYCQ